MSNRSISKYKGCKVWSLENHWIKLHIAPSLGGRIIQLEMNGYEFFFVNPSLIGKEPDSTRLGENGEWLNFGGEKIWPAPQGWDSLQQWPGPPDPILDAGIYTIQGFNDLSKNKGVTLTSPFDPSTGLQIQRDILLNNDRAGATILATFINKSESLKKWAIWPVCQMKTSGIESGKRYHVVCPVNSSSKFFDGFKILHGLVNSPQFRVNASANLLVDYQYLVGKVGLDTDAGWVSYIDKEFGKVFVLMFEYQQGKPYPDDTSVQIWTQGRGMIYSRGKINEFINDRNQNPPYMEMEILSPLHEIQPGKNLQFEYRMLVSTIPPNHAIMSVNELGIIAYHLKLKSGRDGVSVNAGYGVFTNGTIKLQLERAPGDKNPINIYEIPVTPLEGVHIEFIINNELLSDSIAYITVRIYDQENNYLGEIERTNIESKYEH